MDISCVWEHNGDDTLLHAVELPGAFSRGESRAAALEKMDGEVRSYLIWAGARVPETIRLSIVQEHPCALAVRDADSDVLFDAEKTPLFREEYERLKGLVLRSAADFLSLYEAVPDKGRAAGAPRATFYGCVPRTAHEMYLHTKNVNHYYFSQLEVDADNEGTILQCRRRGFEALEGQPAFLDNPIFHGSFQEDWTLRKLLRRFLWHDRIHARALYRMAVGLFPQGEIPNPFHFGPTL